MRIIYRKYRIEDNPFSYIDNEILSLLWFLDGPLKNCDPIKKNRNFTKGYKLDYEEIAISLKLPIKVPDNWEYIPPLNRLRYTTYKEIQPIHRGNYLLWLQNPLTNYESYYKDLFFAGIRQHVVEGGDLAYKALDMFNSFIESYGADGHYFQNYFFNPINCAILSEDDKIVLYALKNIGNKAKGHGVLNAKFLMCDTLSAEDILSLGDYISGIPKRKRYFVDNRELFASVIARIIDVDYDGGFPLMDYVKEVSWRNEKILKNGMIKKVKFPYLYECDILNKKLLEILLLATDLTEEIIKKDRKERRRNG